MNLKSSFVAVLFTLTTSFSVAQEIDVLFTEIPGHPTAVVPGALDATGTPIATDFATMFAINVNPSGTTWIMKATTTQAATESNVMLIGDAAGGAVFAQEAQPVGGGAPGEVYDFFDDLAGIDENGMYVFGARARGGVAAVAEKVIRFNGVNFEIVVQQDDPALGLDDLPPNPAGDETFGNSLNSIHLLDDGRVGFVAVTLTNVHSFRRPALFYDNMAFAQSGVTAIGGEIWDSFDSNDFQTTPDGAHWIAQGDTENATAGIDDILAVDGAIVLQEGMPVGGSAIVMVEVFASSIATSGDWIARGDDANNDDWVVVNNVLYTATGMPVAPASPDVWGPVISIASINASGSVMLAGELQTGDQVLVVDGDVVLREGDPIDVDGNGLFDDDAVLNTFKPQGHLANNGTIHVLATLRNGLGDLLGDTFLRITFGPGSGPEFIRGDANSDSSFSGLLDGLFILSFAFVPGSPAPDCFDAADVNDDGSFSGLLDGLYVLSFAFVPGSPPPPAPGLVCGVDPSADVLDCLSSGCP